MIFDVQVSSQELPPPISEDLKKDTAAIANQCYPLQQVIQWLRCSSILLVYH